MPSEELLQGRVPPQPFVQIEITTKCNFECFYCAGRHMKQENMGLALFEAILQRLGPSPLTVSLQGEGEPTAHPQFWTMIDRLIDLGHRPYIITNASLIDASRVALKFQTIGVSLDTLDEAEAHRIGRYKLPNVLKRIESLIDVMGPERVLVHTVDYGQDTGPVSRYVRAMGARHLIQPIQRKPDYARYYEKSAPVVFWQHKRRCRYLEAPLMRYFDVTGREAPCCFIKDMGAFESAQRSRMELAEGKVPGTCIGCREIAMSKVGAPAYGRNKPH